MLPALIATDVDGTLLDTHERVTPRTRAAVQAASDVLLAAQEDLQETRGPLSPSWLLTRTRRRRGRGGGGDNAAGEIGGGIGKRAYLVR